MLGELRLHADLCVTLETVTIVWASGHRLEGLPRLFSVGVSRLLRLLFKLILGLALLCKDYERLLVLSLRLEFKEFGNEICAVVLVNLVLFLGVNEKDLVSCISVDFEVGLV